MLEAPRGFAFALFVQIDLLNPAQQLANVAEMMLSRGNDVPDIFRGDGHQQHYSGKHYEDDSAALDPADLGPVQQQEAERR